jgi:hypothetical protein
VKLKLKPMRCGRLFSARKIRDGFGMPLITAVVKSWLMSDEEQTGRIVKVFVDVK